MAAVIPVTDTIHAKRPAAIITNSTCPFCAMELMIQVINWPSFIFL